MTARLCAIIFDQKTTAYLEKFESEFGQSAEDEIPAVHTVGDLENTVVELQGVEDGHYLLVVEALFTKQETQACLTLVKAGDKTGIVMRKTIDLQPIIDSELADHDEFLQLAQLPDDKEDCDDEDAELSDAIMNQVNMKRAEYLEGRLAPCLSGNTAFNIRLLDVLDYMVYPVIRNGVTGIDQEILQPDQAKTTKKQPPRKPGQHLN